MLLLFLRQWKSESYITDINTYTSSFCGWGDDQFQKNMDVTTEHLGGFIQDKGLLVFETHAFSLFWKILVFICCNGPVFHNYQSSLSDCILYSTTLVIISHRDLSLGKTIWVYLLHFHINNGKYGICSQGGPVLNSYHPINYPAVSQ